MPTGRPPVLRTDATAIVADGDPVSREYLAGLLERIHLRARAVATGDEALAQIDRELPDIVVLDVRLPGTSGYEVCRDLRDRVGESLPIIFVSDGATNPADEVAGLLLGADHYLYKPVRPDRFLACVRRRLAPARARPLPSTLTPREGEILELLVRGLLPGDIARRLCITPKTTATHFEHILGKLGAHSQAQAVAFAVRDGLVRPAAPLPERRRPYAERLTS